MHQMEIYVTDYEQALPAPTQEQIEIGIDEALSALVAYRKEPPAAAQRARDRRPQSKTFPMYSAEQLLMTGSAVLSARDIATSPVEVGLKRSLKELGMLLYEIVGDDGMLEAAERICGLDEDNWQRRMAPLDHAWDGIGAWHS